MIASKRGFIFSPASLSVPCLRLPVSGASASASDAEPHLRFHLNLQSLRINWQLKSQIALSNSHTLSPEVPLCINIHLNSQSLPDIMNLALTDPFILAQDYPEALTGKLSEYSLLLYLLMLI